TSLSRSAVTLPRETTSLSILRAFWASLPWFLDNHTLARARLASVGAEGSEANVTLLKALWNIKSSRSEPPRVVVSSEYGILETIAYELRPVLTAAASDCMACWPTEGRKSIQNATGTASRTKTRAAVANITRLESGLASRILEPGL